VWPDGYAYPSAKYQKFFDHYGFAKKYRDDMLKGNLHTNLQIDMDEATLDAETHEYIWN
jgi:hypothetical protein